GPLLELRDYVLAGSIDREALGVGRPAAAGDIAKGRRFGIADGDTDLVKLHAKLLGADLKEGRARACDVDSADDQGCGAVRIDVDVGAGGKKRPGPIAQAESPAPVRSGELAVPVSTLLNPVQDLL